MASLKKVQTQLGISISYFLKKSLMLKVKQDVFFTGTGPMPVFKNQT
jgi:hypothetical protein